MKDGLIIVGALIVGLGGCGQNADQPANVVMPSYVEPIPSPAPTFTPAAYATEPPRLHNFDEVEDSTYYYIAAVSEEERKRGKAAGSVSGFRYLGRNADGEHILASVTASGGIGYQSRCPQKCVVIHHSDGGRSAYTPNSIIGAAFEDAIRGRLKRWIAPQPEGPVQNNPPVAEQPQPYPGDPVLPVIHKADDTSPDVGNEPVNAD